jgi:3'-5' exoribonuclease
VKSVMWVEDKAAKAEEALGEPIPKPLIEVLQHIILSHHDKPEFGSPKAPATPEAIAVHMIENMDAKLMMSLGFCRGANAGEGHWTEYLKAFGGRLYRPDVAPADPVDADQPDRIEPMIDGAPIKRMEGGATLKISNPLFEQSPSRKH